MWYEILPGFGIILGFMYIPTFSAFIINDLIVGNRFRRSLQDSFERHCYLRDRRIDPNTDPYILHGLEAIPDEGQEYKPASGGDGDGEQQEEDPCHKLEDVPRDQCPADFGKKVESGEAKTEEGAKAKGDGQPAKAYSLEDDDLCRK